MSRKNKVPFPCDECGLAYAPLYEPLQIARERLEFHVSVAKSGRPANYCRPCLADKLRLLAKELAEEWPDEIIWGLKL